MGLDRLDNVTIGEPCKVDGCSTACVEGEDRCHDHSVNRMIEGLFAPAECSQTLHGETVSMCYRCAEIVQERFHRIDSPSATFGHAIASGFIRSALGIPPMRRDEGEETE